MDKGENRTTNLILRLIDNIDDVELVVLDNVNKEILPITETGVRTHFVEQYKNYSINDIEYMILRNYTGYNFRGINNILRGKWDYEVNGKLDEVKRSRFTTNANEISSLINKFPRNTKAFKTYRGVTIDAFRDYGIYSIEELEYIKGKYMYECGFTSTSLLRETSYFNQEINGDYYNIEIEYIIPANSKDGMPLLTHEYSFSPNQNEYVFDKDTLVKIYDVMIDKENNCAHLKAVLIPKKVYNQNYEIKEKENVK